MLAAMDLKDIAERLNEIAQERHAMEEVLEALEAAQLQEVLEATGKKEQFIKDAMKKGITNGKAKDLRKWLLRQM
jgi:hypothetical protein